MKYRVFMMTGRQFYPVSGLGENLRIDNSIDVQKNRLRRQVRESGLHRSAFTAFFRETAVIKKNEDT
jgi:hypothetical protein